MLQNLRNQIKSDRQVIERLNGESELKAKILEDSGDRLSKDSILIGSKGTAEIIIKRKRLI